jgi:hypothetical protein
MTIMRLDNSFVLDLSALQLLLGETRNLMGPLSSQLSSLHFRKAFLRCQSRFSGAGQYLCSAGTKILLSMSVSMCPGKFCSRFTLLDTNTLYSLPTLIRPSSKYQWQSRQRAIPLVGLSSQLTLQGK